MGRVFSQVPVLVLLSLLAGAMMFVPALYASFADFDEEARHFFYSGLLIVFASLGIALATARRRVVNPSRAALLTLFGSYLLLPALAAIPLYEGIGTTFFINAYVEMVSAFTTTGATVFLQDDRLSLPLHLWRAQVAWVGGLWIWISALALMAPLRLGGFEMLRTARALPETDVALRSLGGRLSRATKIAAPIYLTLTLVLWLALTVFGEPGFDALILAMGTLSTSGITLATEGVSLGGGFASELLIAFFLIFALSRETFADGIKTNLLARWKADRELRLGLTIIIVLPTLLFARHWIGTLDITVIDDPLLSLRAYWGSIFTTLSFLTTTGFESAAWQDTRMWSGLSTPGILLLGVAMFGGGVGTTAGGVKLLRIYALYRHGRHEMALLVHPSSMASAYQQSKTLTSDRVRAAWVFFMLFALSIAGLAVAFSYFGLAFEEAITLTTAALTTTGPLLELAAAQPVLILDLENAAKAVFTFAMIMGRLETLAVIALLNPDFWRS